MYKPGSYGLVKGKPTWLHTDPIVSAPRAMSSNCQACHHQVDLQQFLTNLPRHWWHKALVHGRLDLVLTLRSDRDSWSSVALDLAEVGREPANTTDRPIRSCLPLIGDARQQLARADAWWNHRTIPGSDATSGTCLPMLTLTTTPDDESYDCHACWRTWWEDICPGDQKFEFSERELPNARRCALFTALICCLICFTFGAQGSGFVSCQAPIQWLPTRGYSHTSWFFTFWYAGFDIVAVAHEHWYEPVSMEQQKRHSSTGHSTLSSARVHFVCETNEPSERNQIHVTPTGGGNDPLENSPQLMSCSISRENDPRGWFR